MHVRKGGTKLSLVFGDSVAGLVILLLGGWQHDIRYLYLVPCSREISLHQVWHSKAPRDAESQSYPKKFRLTDTPTMTLAPTYGLMAV